MFGAAERPAFGQDKAGVQDKGGFKELPPVGIDVSAEVVAELQGRLAALRTVFEEVAQRSNDLPAWAPDVLVLLRAVDLAIGQKLFYKPEDIDTARKTLGIAEGRIDAVSKGTRGIELLSIGSRGKDAGRTLAGGFVSEIDGSEQPYGLVLPVGFREAVAADPQRLWRLDVWLHGRGDTNTEIPFLQDRLSKLGQHAPADTLVLHPFGRHCNAFKFAGETDVFESIRHLMRWLKIDPLRISIRGFSMGGAGTWHLAAHHPDRWFAANPGAGFVDTIRYQGWDTTGVPYDPGHWGKRLMAWYDMPPWVDNLRNTRVIAYSGEVDKQRQAAEFMVEAAKRSGFEIPHVIGAGMGHKIDPASGEAIDRQLAAWSAEAKPAHRDRIDLVTYTLRYPQIDWLTVEGLSRHWDRAVVKGELVKDSSSPLVKITSENVTDLSLDFGRFGWPLASGDVTLELNGQRLACGQAQQGRPFSTRVAARDGKWGLVDEAQRGSDRLRKRPGLQGPIDDALTSPLLFVLPSGKSESAAIASFVEREIAQARRGWERVMRGKFRTVLDTELTPDQIARHNLICFGDFQSNRYLASIADRLPIVWTDEAITVGGRRFDANGHALVAVYPNPKNPNRYVVINSGVTFRESSNTTNSRQIAMLPDWAVVDVAVAPDGFYPGRIVAADFFDERWQVAAPAEKP
jgi:pimeloyl-ACP methyl ester carboxylesterase